MIFSVLPGPGFPFLIAGLATLAVEFAWARTYVDQLRHHADRLRTKSSSYLPRRLRPTPSPIIGIDFSTGTGTAPIVVRVDPKSGPQSESDAADPHRTDTHAPAVSVEDAEYQTELRRPD
jgi:hypothetical protein